MRAGFVGLPGSANYVIYIFAVLLYSRAIESY